MLKNVILSLVLFFACFGCGIKGDPLPPIEQENTQKKLIETPEKKVEPVISEKPADKKTKKKKIIKNEN